LRKVEILLQDVALLGIFSDMPSDEVAGTNRFFNGKLSSTKDSSTKYGCLGNAVVNTLDLYLFI
jgi:hypothetical protein